MEDPAAAMEDHRAAAVAADLASLGISCEFSIEYGLGWVFRWGWIVFGLGLLVAVFGGGAGFGDWVVILACWVVVIVGEERIFLDEYALVESDVFTRAFWEKVPTVGKWIVGTGKKAFGVQLVQKDLQQCMG
nr:hypothetical protein CFP56_22093 [Quercus suber]